MADMAQYIPALIDWLADGKTQKSFCEINKIPVYMLQRYISKSPNTANELLRARAQGAMAEADEIQAIADDPSINTNQARNMIDVRKWRASKFLPKVFGDRIDMNVNQVIDIGGALIDARKRALQPIGNHAQITDAQVTDYVRIAERAHSDIESSEPADGQESDAWDVFK